MRKESPHIAWKTPPRRSAMLLGPNWNYQGSRQLMNMEWGVTPSYSMPAFISSFWLPRRRSNWASSICGKIALRLRLLCDIKREDEGCRPWWCLGIWNAEHDECLLSSDLFAVTIMDQGPCSHKIASSALLSRSCSTILRATRSIWAMRLLPSSSICLPMILCQSCLLTTNAQHRLRLIPQGRHLRRHHRHSKTMEVPYFLLPEVRFHFLVRLIPFSYCFRVHMPHRSSCHGVVSRVYNSHLARLFDGSHSRTNDTQW